MLLMLRVLFRRSFFAFGLLLRRGFCLLLSRLLGQLMFVSLLLFGFLGVLFLGLLCMFLGFLMVLLFLLVLLLIWFGDLLFKSQVNLFFNLQQ